MTGNVRISGTSRWWWDFDRNWKRFIDVQRLSRLRGTRISEVTRLTKASSVGLIAWDIFDVTFDHWSLHSLHRFVGLVVAGINSQCMWISIFCLHFVRVNRSWFMLFVCTVIPKHASIRARLCTKTDRKSTAGLNKTRTIAYAVYDCGIFCKVYTTHSSLR